LTFEKDKKAGPIAVFIIFSRLLLPLATPFFPTNHPSNQPCNRATNHATEQRKPVPARKLSSVARVVYRN
jgi:hypothetical protein